jgi:two-component system response regulator LytT
MNIIIIEDELLMANELATFISDFDSDNKVVAQLQTVSDAIDYLQKNDMPDLFFSDIQLPDGLSFEIFQAVNCKVPVVFCTAFDAYSLKAFQANGIDYLLKPFDRNAIHRALEKVNRLIGKPEQAVNDYLELLHSFLNTKSSLVKNILVYKGDKIIPISIDEIAIARIDNGSTYIVNFDSKQWPTDESLDSLQQIFGQTFYRVNRQFLVNRKAVRHVSKYFARKLLVEVRIDFPDKLIISKARASDFLKWIRSQ